MGFARSSARDHTTRPRAAAALFARSGHPAAERTRAAASAAGTLRSQSRAMKRHPLMPSDSRGQPHYRHGHDLRIEQHRGPGLAGGKESGRVGWSARHQDVGGHARAFEVFRPAGAICFERRLRCAIGGEPRGQHGVETGRHIDDAAPSALDHRNGREARHQKSADAIDRENALPSLRIGFEELDAGSPVTGGMRHADPGAVDQNIKLLKPGERLLDGISAGGGLRHVGRDLEQPSRKHGLCRQSPEPRSIDVDRGDARTGISQCACHHPPHAACCSGDDGYPACKQLLIGHERPPT